MSTTAVLDHPTVPAARPLLTCLQGSWLGLQVVVLAAVAATALVLNPKDFALLWQEPLGIKMSAWAGIYLLLNVLVFGGGCALCNRFIAHAIGRKLVATGLAAACLFLFYLPALFVLLHGPAVLAIQRNLAL